MKILHTSDVHLDRCFTGAGTSPGLGASRRQSLRAAFGRVIARAKEWPADVLLIAGDLFELDRVSVETVTFLREQFASIPDTQVFIAAGNSDPCVPESPYLTETWPSNVHIFSKPAWETVALPDDAGFVHGFGFDLPFVSANPFGQLTIPEKRRDAIHIAVGYGSERGSASGSVDDVAPFDAKDATPAGLDYLALGHRHEHCVITGDFETTVCYSGAPEGMRFSESGQHYFVEAEISDGTVSFTAVPCSRVVYVDETVACDGCASTQEVIEAIRSSVKAQDGRVVGRYTLTGSCDATIQSEIGLIYDATALEFEYLELVDQTTPSEDFEELAREDTSLGLYVRALNDQIAETNDRARRAMLERSRELGVAAFRNRNVEIRGLERG